MHANLQAVAVLVLVALIAGRTDAQTKPTEPLPLAQVADYMAAYSKNTTFRNEHAAKRLVGHVFKGVMEVVDVAGNDTALSIQAQLGETGNAQFTITKPDIIKKAAELSRGAKVTITAKLDGLYSPGGAVEASFSETQGVEIVPAERQTEPRPLSAVVNFMEDWEQNTTIKNRQIETDLVGRVYTGIVEVWDVRGDSTFLTVEARPSETHDSRFLHLLELPISNPEIIKKAAALPRHTKLSITAKLLRFPVSQRGQGGPGTAYFDEVQSLESVPAEK